MSAERRGGQWLWTAAGLVTAILAGGSACLADERAHHDQHRAPHDNTKVHNHHHGSHLSALLGSTLHGDEEATTYGIDYEYRFGDVIGVGVVAEHAVAPVDATTLLAVADIHLWRELALQTGPGAEILHTATTENDPRFVYRFGLLYEFAYGRITLSPQLHYDVVPGDMENSVVAALAFGLGF